ncbi:MAG: ImmA/IrrE family metallo-endopeptidase, partial [Lachnospiraceae bacterium]|nr:ImmA/IrrE family metallo-endopeptidase [Lachnospiraceae bacterium]
MLGTSVEMWLNLQKVYDRKKLEIEQRQALQEQEKLVAMIDYSYFVKVAKLPQTRKASEKVQNLCGFFKVFDLRVMLEPDFLVNFRAGIPTLEQKNIINAQAWLQTAMNFSKDIPVSEFDAAKLRSALPKIREMTRQKPEIFLPRLAEIFAGCGVAFVLLPLLKNSGINGAVKWDSANRVLLALNDRRCYADTFWFSLFHEIKHVLQQKTRIVFISSELEQLNRLNQALEEEADKFAQDYLIPPAEYKKFSPDFYTSDADIEEFAERIGVHPGIVAGRLQHDKIIAPNRCSKLKVKYHIVIDK